MREKSEKTAAELERRPTAAAVEELTGRIRTLQALVDAEDGDALEAGERLPIQSAHHRRAGMRSTRGFGFT